LGKFRVFFPLLLYQGSHPFPIRLLFSRCQCFSSSLSPGRFNPPLFQPIMAPLEYAMAPRCHAPVFLFSLTPPSFRARSDCLFIVSSVGAIILSCEIYRLFFRLSFVVLRRCQAFLRLLPFSRFSAPPSFPDVALNAKNASCFIMIKCSGDAARGFN